jgi:DNA-binding transcriptional MerR regulator
MAGQKQESDDEEEPKEGMFPMRIVTRLTGLNPDTIRAWERRYGAITPPRTEGNTRLFTHDDIERLIVLRAVVDLGHPIGQVASLPTAALKQLRDIERGHTTQSAPDSLASLRQDYLEAISRFEARRGTEILHQAAAHLPAREFAFKLALPILREVGELWSHTADDKERESSFGVAHEHLATVQMRNALLTYQHLFPVDRGAPRVVVTTLEGHRHEFGILIGALLAQIRGFEVIYLGVDLPADDILWAARRANAVLVILGAAVPIRELDSERLDHLALELPPRTELWLGLTPTDTYAHPQVRRFTAFEQLDLALAEKRG